MTNQVSVLVVEDHLVSMQRVDEMLKFLRYTVHTAGSAEDAIPLIKLHQFDILVSDLNLPGMSGFDLAKFAMAHQPALKVIFISGFGYLVAEKTDFEFILLPKPYSLMQLAETMQNVLQRPEEFSP